MDSATLSWPRERRQPAGPFLAIAVTVIAGSWLYPLAAAKLPYFSTCLFHRLTGLPCLFCGMTRSFAATARLDMGAALSYHLLGPAFFGGMLAVAGVAGWSLVTGRRMPRPSRRLARAAAWLTLAALVAAWAARLALYGNNI